MLLGSSVLLNTFFALCLLLAPSTAPQTTSDRFDLRGKVINAVTGEPVSGALVQLSDQKSVFSQSDGSFVFTNLSRGQVVVVARKPGFFNDQGVSQSNPGMSSMTPVPFAGEVVAKLTPEGIIFGQVTNENGDPMYAVAVRAQRWKVVDGRRQLQVVAEARTDDEGNFRLAELTSGGYYLAFEPVDRGIRVNGLRRKKQDEEGYGLQFYPGSSDFAAATTVQVRPGAQLRISHTFRPQHLFDVSGIVRGANLENSFQLMLVSSSGASAGRKDDCSWIGTASDRSIR
jgi:Carboxypeptidase regulatory-like domain